MISMGYHFSTYRYFINTFVSIGLAETWFLIGLAQQTSTSYFSIVDEPKHLKHKDLKMENVIDMKDYRIQTIENDVDQWSQRFERATVGEQFDMLVELRAVARVSPVIRLRKNEGNPLSKKEVKEILLASYNLQSRLELEAIRHKPDILKKVLIHLDE